MKIEIQGFKAWLFVFFTMIGAIDIFILTPAITLIASGFFKH